MALINHLAATDSTVSRLTQPLHAIKENIEVHRCTPKYENMDSYSILRSVSCYWVLPIPTTLTYDSEYQWAGEELTHGSAVAAGAGNAIAMARNGDVTGAISNFASTTAGIVKTIPMATMRGAIQKVGDSLGVQGNQVLKEMERANGLAYNPNQQLYFNGIELRDFSVSFNLSPTSKEEANSIKVAFQKLAYSAAPEYSTDRFYFTYPDFFKFTVVVNDNGNGDHNVMYEREDLAITNISLDLSPENALTWHDDGFPTALTLSVSFKESVVPTRNNLSKITLFGKSLNVNKGKGTE